MITEAFNINYKTCPQCGKEKPESEFNRTRWGGTTEHCRECIAENQRNKKAQLNAMRERRRTETSAALADYTSRELIAELKARGYSGELKYVQKITL